MPTGYTAPVIEGEGMTFEQFALRCARAFGALLEMRDEPLSAPIPDEFAPSGTYAGWARDAEAKMSALLAMTSAGIEQAARAEFEKRQAGWHTACEAAEQNRRRLVDMRIQVVDWTPPSPDHVKLKRFMLEQLDETIEWDGRLPGEPPTMQEPEEWHKAQLASCESNAIRYKDMDREEIERVRGRNEWLRALRESLRPKG